MEGGYTLQGEKSDPESILISVKDNLKYITFDETRDTGIFGFLRSFHDIMSMLENWTVRRKGKCFG
jgi:hypothetical protein